MNFGLLYRPCYPHWPALGGMLRPSPGHIRRCKIHCQVVGMGVFARIFRELARPGTDGEIVVRRTRPTPHLPSLCRSDERCKRKGGLALLDALPRAELLIADKGYGADWFRGAPAELGIVACIRHEWGRKHPPTMTPSNIANGTGELLRPPQGLASNCYTPRQI
jgi:hypothetical protein